MRIVLKRFAVDFRNQREKKARRKRRIRRRKQRKIMRIVEKRFAVNLLQSSGKNRLAEVAERRKQWEKGDRRFVDEGDLWQG